MSELKPCPFCGGESEYVYGDDNEQMLDMWSVSCSNAKCEVIPCTLSCHTKEEAAAAWNTRHVETCRLNELDALTQTLSMVNGCAWGECSECGCLTPDDSTYCINCGRKVEG